MRSGSPFRTASFLVLLLGCWWGTPATAQPSPGIILKGGLVSSDFTALGVGGGFGGAATGIDSFGVPSFGGGIATRVGLSGRFGLQVEALFVRKAADIDLFLVPFPAFGQSGLTVRARADYIELPVLVRYEIGSGATHPYLLGGPAVAFRLGSSVSGDGLGRVIDAGLIRPDLADGMRRTDVVLGVGAGVDFSADRGRGWNFELRAEWGLTRLFDDLDNAPVPTDVEARTRAFLALVGFRL